MPELGFVVFLIAVGYATGIFWNTLLGRSYNSWLRMSAFPLLGIVIGEAIWTKYISGAVGEGLVFLDLHIYVALVSSFTAVMVDLAFSWLAKEHPVTDTLKALTRTHPTLPR